MFLCHFALCINLLVTTVSGASLSCHNSNNVQTAHFTAAATARRCLSVQLREEAVRHEPKVGKKYTALMVQYCQLVLQRIAAFVTFCCFLKSTKVSKVVRKIPKSPKSCQLI